MSVKTETCVMACLVFVRLYLCCLTCRLRVYVCVCVSAVPEQNTRGNQWMGGAAH